MSAGRRLWRWWIACAAWTFDSKSAVLNVSSHPHCELGQLSTSTISLPAAWPLLVVRRTRLSVTARVFPVAAAHTWKVLLPQYVSLLPVSLQSTSEDPPMNTFLCTVPMRWLVVLDAVVPLIHCLHRLQSRGLVFTAVCPSVLFSCAISQKPMQLGSANSKYRILQMFHDESWQHIYFGVKGHESSGVGLWTLVSAGFF